MSDCMVAAVARRADAAVLAQDADSARVARVVGIALGEATSGS